MHILFSILKFISLDLTIALCFFWFHYFLFHRMVDSCLHYAANKELQRMNVHMFSAAGYIAMGLPPSSLIFLQFLSA